MVRLFSQTKITSTHKHITTHTMCMYRLIWYYQIIRNHWIDIVVAVIFCQVYFPSLCTHEISVLDFIRLIQSFLLQWLSSMVYSLLLCLFRSIIFRHTFAYFSQHWLCFASFPSFQYYINAIFFWYFDGMQYYVHTVEMCKNDIKETDRTIYTCIYEQVCLPFFSFVFIFASCLW